MNNKLGHLTSSFTDVVRTNGSDPLGTLPTTTTPALSKIIKIAAAGSHTCALDVTGQVHCWGRWDGSSISLAMPVFGTNPGIIDLTAGGDLGVDGSGAEAASNDHTCALASNHHLWCWGTNADGQLGDGTTTQRTAPVEVGLSSSVALDDIVAIAAGDRHTCATTLDDRTFCWGANGDGQLSRTTSGATILRPVATEPVGASSPLSGVHTIAAGKAFNCVSAINSLTLHDGSVKCWGRNDVGQLGNGTTTSSTNPVITFTPDTACNAGVEPFQIIYYVWTSPHGGPLLDAGHEHTCAFVERSECYSSTSTTGTVTRGVLCWGRNDLQQLGANNTATSRLPTFIALDAQVTQLSAGNHHTCAVDSVGRVWCWGANGIGQCGQSTSTPTVNVPTQVVLGDLPPAVQVTAGKDFTCALLSDGTVACWGSNQFGTLGRETPDPLWMNPGVAPPPVVKFGLGEFSATPERVHCGISTCSGCTHLTAVKQVSAGSDAVCALLADGTVRCWGHNPRAGQGNTTAIFGTCNDLRFCGAVSGQTPYFPNDDPLLPLMEDVLPFAGSVNANFGTVPLAVSVSTHDKGACIVRENGLAQCWGSQDSGRAGNGINGGLTQNILDVQITTGSVVLDNVAGINGGWATKCAVLNNGEVHCWGFNNVAQAGRDPMGGLLNSLLNPVVLRTTATTDFGGAIAVAVGQSHGCTMTAGRQISCWGDNTNTHLGRTGTGNEFAQPIDIP